MRDYRDAKAMAQTLRSALAAKGVKLSIGEALELIAKAFGFASWNTLSAAIKAPPKDEPKDAPPPDPKTALEQLAKALGPQGWDELLAIVRAAARPTPAADSTPAMTAAATSATSPADSPPADPPRSGVRFSAALAATIHRATAAAKARDHEYTSLEHLLLALADDPDASVVIEACAGDLTVLKSQLTRYVDEDLKLLVKPGVEPRPTAGFHRVIQRAVIHVQSSGGHEATGANVLVAIFSERESHAAYYLREQKMTREDAVFFIVHGIRKGDTAA